MGYSFPDRNRNNSMEMNQNGSASQLNINATNPAVTPRSGDFNTIPLVNNNNGVYFNNNPNSSPNFNMHTNRPIQPHHTVSYDNEIRTTNQGLPNSVLGSPFQDAAAEFNASKTYTLKTPFDQQQNQQSPHQQNQQITDKYMNSTHVSSCSISSEPAVPVSVDEYQEEKSKNVETLLRQEDMSDKASMLILKDLNKALEKSIEIYTKIDTNYLINSENKKLDTAAIIDEYLNKLNVEPIVKVTEKLSNSVLKLKELKARHMKKREEKRKEFEKLKAKKLTMKRKLEKTKSTDLKISKNSAKSITKPPIPNKRKAASTGSIENSSLIQLQLEDACENAIFKVRPPSPFIATKKQSKSLLQNQDSRMEKRS
ncbi:unnamed protein product [[Candida] boidinii]|nr:unnamed protein product [[Candida] boidinii]